MARPINTLLITTGVITLIQAAGQAVFAAFAIAQYYCVIDFLRQYSILIYIRILYFHNPDRCGVRINIGETIDGVANQALVLVSREPFTTHRTFLVNYIGLSLSILWVVGSILLIKGGTRKHHSNHTHWPWLMITLTVTLLDIVAVIAYVNDSFHTKTLTQLMSYVGGTVSGMGNVDVDTTWAPYLMAIIYSRFIIFLLCNVTLMICAVVDCTRFRSSVTSSEVERNQGGSLEDSAKDSDEVTSPSPDAALAHGIPRPGVSRSFRDMKHFLFNETTAHAPASTQTSFNDGRHRHRGVNFLGEVEPRTLENMIGEQQKRLNISIVDTAGRRSPGHGSRSPTRAHSLANLSEPSPGRGTALQGQMPWSYIPASANRMRDQLPPDEDLPPVPLPDYTAFQSARKASVHRAASSLSSMTQKKDYMSYQSPHQPPPRSADGAAWRFEAAQEVVSDESTSLEASDEYESVFECVRLSIRADWPPGLLPPPAPKARPPRNLRPVDLELPMPREFFAGNCIKLYVSVLGLAFGITFLVWILK